MIGERDFHIRHPKGEEWRRFRQLLVDAALPSEGAEPRDDARFLIAVDVAGSLLGGGGFEGGPAEALLRSLVVRPHARNGGLGTALLDAVEDMAVAAGVTRLYLLTTTAADFFLRRGYRRIPRDAMPLEIRRTEQFVHLCPASADGMVFDLSNCRATRV